MRRSVLSRCSSLSRAGRPMETRGRDLTQLGRRRAHRQSLCRSRRLTQAEEVRGGRRSCQHGGQARRIEPDSRNGHRHEWRYRGSRKRPRQRPPERIICRARPKPCRGRLRAAWRPTRARTPGPGSVVPACYTAIPSRFPSTPTTPRRLRHASICLRSHHPELRIHLVRPARTVENAVVAGPRLAVMPGACTAGGPREVLGGHGLAHRADVVLLALDREEKARTRASR